MSKSLTTINLSPTEAIVLQQIHDDIEDDVVALSEQLSMPRGRVAMLVSALKSKGLLIFEHDYSGTWIRLSNRGNHLMQQLWPEAALRAG